MNKQLIIRGAYKILQLAIILTFFACKPSYVSEQELKQYILNPKNGLYKEAKEDLHEVKLTYRPTELLVAQELKRKDTISTEEIEQIKKNYDTYAHFILSLSYDGHEYINKGLSDPNQYGSLIEQLAFDMSNQVELVTSKYDTIPVANAIFSRMYGMTKSNTIMLAFNAEKIKESQSFKFRFKTADLGFIDQSFEFKRKDINKIPKLNILKQKQFKNIIKDESFTKSKTNCN